MFLRRFFLAYVLCISTVTSVTYTMDENKNCCKGMITTIKKITKIPGNIIMLSSSLADLPLIYVFAKIEDPLLDNINLNKKSTQATYNALGSLLLHARPYFIAKCLRGDCSANLIVNPLSLAIEQGTNDWVKFYLDHGSNSNGGDAPITGGRELYWQTAIRVENEGALDLLCKNGLRKSHIIEALRSSIDHNYIGGIDVCCSYELGLETWNMNDMSNFLQGLPKAGTMYFLEQKLNLPWVLYEAGRRIRRSDNAKDRIDILRAVIQEHFST